MYNPKINWKTWEVKIMKYPPLCRRNMKRKEDRKAEKGKRVATIEEEKIVRWAVCYVIVPRKKTISCAFINLVGNI